jgi:hypothetical protein
MSVTGLQNIGGVWSTGLALASGFGTDGETVGRFARAATRVDQIPKQSLSVFGIDAEMKLRIAEIRKDARGGI